jgi:mono/diheme cytochrome c family protein
MLPCRNFLFLSALPLLVSLSLSPLSWSQSPPGQKKEDPLRFEVSLLPILEQKCLTCHSETLKQNGLDLRTRDNLLKGGESGPAIVPGSAKDSLLYKKVSTGAMPPGNQKLSPAEIASIALWIDSGALRQGEDPGLVTRKEVTEPEFLVAVFESKCITCHGKWVKEGNLDLRTRAGYLKGGKSGPAIVPGKPEKSLAYLRIVAGEMPPKVAKGSPHYVRPVTASETEKLKQWIAAGASSNGEEAPVGENGVDPLVSSKDRQFWSFQPPKRPSVPDVASPRVRTPIDAFVLKKLESKRLTFSPDAERVKLLRRAFFDLIGLPPSRSDIDAFLNDYQS